MKTMYKLIFLLPAFMLGATSCNFLDVVPDERPTEADMFADFQAARRYLYSCYAYLPNPKNGAYSLDLMTGDEVVTAFEHEAFAKFCVGQFTASNPVISYWNTLFQGLRQCYIMLENIDDVPGMEAHLKEDYKAQVHFLIAYYHFLQMRCYGSCILVKSLPNLSTPKDEYLGRSPFEECVAFVCEEFDKAAAVLPARRTIPYEEGLATSTAAKALKAKLLLYAASPLFNGGGEDGGGIEGYLRGFKDKNGVQLMPLTYDPTKWATAKKAIGEAIEAAEAAGYTLEYPITVTDGSNPHPQKKYDFQMRYTPIASAPEVIWSDNRSDDVYGVAVKSLPHVESRAWNGVGPTLAMLKRFYTENGLPVEEDPDFYDEQDWWKRQKASELFSADRDTTRFGNLTMLFNLKREPRYYAWVAFQGSYFEVVSAASSGGYAKDKTYKDGRLVCDFVIGGNVSRQPDSAKSSYRINNFSPSGFLNKKFVSPQMVVGTDNINLVSHPWPIIRLTDLYLMYAEACVETEDLETAKRYLNDVRARAGVPNVEVAWQKAKSGDKTQTQEGLRGIVRQERQIELYLENQNFWDMRRWLLAAEAFDAMPMGMNVDGTKFPEDGTGQDDAFNRLVPALGSGGIHHFANPTHYFLPIPIEDVNRNPNVTQNPGY
ncbi:MAG: RagB/SusD family nutrient uptake outer membrane protein [Prevotellaceae bacterium]|jgi:hypothetical protein|nr:RagB/SusD family nutrient uptake outer membrane protein [Prevotellaceae bacterium]